MRADERFESVQPGIVTRHQFSAGAHYDPDNIAFGPVVGIDEHVVEPGAGFDWHGHRGVHIVSSVLEGMLRHEDSHGVERLVGPGLLLVQSTGDGIRHRETNASDTERLRFVQLTFLVDAPAAVQVAWPPVEFGGVTVTVVRGAYEAGGSTRQIITVLDGGLHDEGHTTRYGPGDSIRLAGDEGVASLVGNGTALVVSLSTA